MNKLFVLLALTLAACSSQGSEAAYLFCVPKDMRLLTRDEVSAQSCAETLPFTASGSIHEEGDWLRVAFSVSPTDRARVERFLSANQKQHVMLLRDRQRLANLVLMTTDPDRLELLVEARRKHEMLILLGLESK
ncbi:hypothetical protein ACFOED_06430 [Vulcaniibacterium thermophilum]|uniref:hypothetical protein n=1 Tax=Vulcaniibacterium thermophilum TaxID=1169913 RepID=UPI0011B3F248|nr:hypothetical protein [Vulcaniibacterium thermophilum]